ncbi:MAG: hypothetical protein LBH03_01960 [Holophagales bacterium]|jgi:hypothetical protein|nr:hypothetical protein [Holophagales bacterium]
MKLFLNVGDIMFRTSHSVHTLARPEEVWNVIKDVSRWRSWFLDVELVQLHGPLVIGMQGLLYFIGDRVYTMLIKKCSQGYMEILVNLRFGVKMRFVANISLDPSGSKIKLESELLGLMAIFNAWGFGKKIKTGLVSATRRLGALSQETRV